jgi:hypothetical protein
MKYLLNIMYSKKYLTKNSNKKAIDQMGQQHEKTTAFFFFSYFYWHNNSDIYDEHG